MIRKLILCAILITLLAVPVFAQTYNYDAPSGEAITSFSVTCPIGTYASYSLRLNNGNIVTGSFSNEATKSLWLIDANKGYVEIGGDSDTRTNVPPEDLIVYVEASSRILNTTQQLTITGAAIKDAPYIQANVAGQNSPVIGYSITSDSTFGTPSTETGDLVSITQNLQGNDADRIGQVMSLIYSTFWSAYNFITDLVYWLKFFFIDNIAMIVALFLAVPMAFAAKNSRGNPEKFLRQYFKSLKGFFEFVLSIWRMLLETIGTVRGWFRL